MKKRFASRPHLLFCLVAALIILSTGQLVGQSRTWDSNDQGQGVAVPADVVRRLVDHDRRIGKIDELDASFRRKLQGMLADLRKRGWAARIAIGPRSVEQQIKEFKEGDSKVLRGSHLCGRAADISLYPMGMPANDHEFWDIKDRAARAAGLKVLPATGSFIDRPHVALSRCTDKDWDRLGLSPSGTFTLTEDGARLDLVFKRTKTGWKGTMTLRGHGSAESITMRDLKFSRTSGAVQKETVSFKVTSDGETAEASGEFSGVKRDNLVRPDYRKLTIRIDGQAKVLERTKP